MLYDKEHPTLQSVAVVVPPEQELVDDELLSELVDVDVELSSCVLLSSSSS